MQVRDIFDLLNRLAPDGLAMDWDNVGLQLGRPEWPAGKILLTLDVTPSAADYATARRFDLIVSHHPLIFKPFRAVTRPEVLNLARAGIAVIALHTNLDVVPQGVNYSLADVLGLQVLGLLSEETGAKWYHGSVTVPPLYAEKVMETIHSAGAGRIGCYDCCSTRHEITGTFRPLEGSNPLLGRHGKLEKVDEVELEFMVDSFNLSAVQRAIAKAHPYETPAVYFVEAQNANPAFGLGLVCELKKALKLSALAEQVKARLKAPFVRLWTAGKDKDTLVRTVAVCGGAGGSLISLAAGKADVFITGDINYHALLESAIPLINAGHFYTEYPVLNKLKKLLAEEGIKADLLPLSRHEINNQLLV